MKLTSVLLTVVLAAAVAFGVSKYAGPMGGESAKKETAFERVMRTNTLRCSYLVMPPQLTRDPNTGAFSGVSYDIVTEAAKRLGLKVEWTEEVTFISVAEGFKTGRYDSFCLASYRWVPGTRAMEYTTPLYFSTTNAYVRSDDHRFDDNLTIVNDPKTTVATIDGEASTFIRAADFPLSSAYSLPNSTDPSLLIEAVATNKADIAFSNPLMIMPYLTANPGKVRRVDGLKPIRSYSHALSFGKGEHDMLTMFNIVIEEMHSDGTIDKILNKYEAIPNSFIRIKNPMDTKAKGLNP